MPWIAWYGPRKTGVILNWNNPRGEYAFFFSNMLDLGYVIVNTVHMNKFTLATHSIIQSVKTLACRSYYTLRGQTYRPDRGPQWQQLELPFTRTPVRRWNR